MYAVILTFSLWVSPLLAAGLIGVVGQRWSGWRWAAHLAVLVALPGLAAVLWAAQEPAFTTTFLRGWLPGMDLCIHWDRAAWLLLLAVWGVGSCVAAVSVYYMEEEEGQVRYFAWLCFFLFAMSWLVLAGNLITLIVGWELVGLASYILIGHWFRRTEAAFGSLQALFINRVGDVFILAGLALLWPQAHLAWPALATLPAAEFALPASLIAVGGLVKSAQVPFQVWLPGAMAGPTPISALLHAATMVTAGVYLAYRMYPLLPPITLEIIAHIGLITALWGGFMALFQTNLKRLLAFSTISQLGLMVFALGSQFPDAGFLHLFSHAWFKAGLFLTAAGLFAYWERAAHATHLHLDVQAVANLRGLGRTDRTVGLLLSVFLLALAGLPFTAAFLTKEGILQAAFYRWGPYSVQVSLLCGVLLLTSVYSTRLLWLVWARGSALPDGLLHPGARLRSSWVLFPLALLVVASGWYVLGANPLDAHHLWLQVAHPPAVQGAALLSLVILIAGALLSWVVFARSSASAEVQPKPIFVFLRHQLGMEALFARLLPGFAHTISHLLARLDKDLLDRLIDTKGNLVYGAQRHTSLSTWAAQLDKGLTAPDLQPASQALFHTLNTPEGTAPVPVPAPATQTWRPTLGWAGVGRAAAWLDNHGVDALLLAFARVPLRLGRLTRRAHGGRVQGYLLYSLLVLLLLLLAAVYLSPPAN
jgi:NADH-quinone oxidoreductase subunit L